MTVFQRMQEELCAEGQARCVRVWDKSKKRFREAMCLPHAADADRDASSGPASLPALLSCPAHKAESGAEDAGAFATTPESAKDWSTGNELNGNVSEDNKRGFGIIGRTEGDIEFPAGAQQPEWEVDDVAEPEVGKGYKSELSRGKRDANFLPLRIEERSLSLQILDLLMCAKERGLAWPEIVALLGLYRPWETRKHEAIRKVLVKNFGVFVSYENIGKVHQTRFYARGHVPKGSLALTAPPPLLALPAPPLTANVAPSSSPGFQSDTPTCQAAVTIVAVPEMKTLPATAERGEEAEYQDSIASSTAIALEVVPRNHGRGSLGTSSSSGVKRLAPEAVLFLVSLSGRFFSMIAQWKC